jgi:hypothetical protein
MVGIYAKIKNGLNHLKGAALKNVAPIVGTIGDIAQSDFMQGLAGMAGPVLDTFIPGLGMGINKGLSWIGKAGDIANGLTQDYALQGDQLGYSDIFKNVTSGKYTKSAQKSMPKGGINLAQRPDQLHPRVELKALPPPGEYEPVTQSYVEEVD